MSLRQLEILICVVQSRMSSMPVDSSRFKGSLIVNRRLMKLYKESKRAIYYGCI
jgi:hypothetical protein